MPKKEVDYSKTHFYKIVCKDLNIKDCYVGHTTNFKQRKSGHKRTCYNEKDQVHYNFYVYQFIRENGGFENFDMVLISTEHCNDALDARAKERSYIEQLKPSLNQIKRPVRSDEEVKEYRKQYYEENNEEIKQKNKQYRIDNDEIVKQRAKTYRENHKEERSKKHKEWSERNAEKIKLQRRIKTTCGCGAVFCQKSIRRHERSNRHQAYLQTLEN